jgi:Uncharacterized protein conserved in bacteria (DUF2255)
MRGDGVPRDPVTIWVVRLGYDLCVRSWRDGSWFRAARAPLLCTALTAETPQVFFQRM